MQTKTTNQYDAVIKTCKDLFLKKTKDYGTAWRVLRISSITDQIFIKAQRIRTLEDKKVSKVDEGIIPEYIGIINYCVIAMIQLELTSPELELEVSIVNNLFDQKISETKSLMEDKNHDYGEAWRDIHQGKGGMVIGGAYFDATQKKGKEGVKERMMKEVAKTIEIACEISPLLDLYDIKLEIHADINPDVRFDSNKALSEAVGYMLGWGMILKLNHQHQLLQM